MNFKNIIVLISGEILEEPLKTFPGAFLKNIFKKFLAKSKISDEILGWILGELLETDSVVNLGETSGRFLERIYEKFLGSIFGGFFCKRHF